VWRLCDGLEGWIPLNDGPPAPSTTCRLAAPRLDPIATIGAGPTRRSGAGLRAVVGHARRADGYESCALVWRTTQESMAFVRHREVSAGNAHGVRF
jgi:hypothetical protein